MTVHGFRLYWLTWASVMFLTFIIPEVYALCTDWHRTLSAAVWHIEDLVPGEHIWQWTAAHYWFMAIYLALVLWLAFHFSMGWWR